MSSQIIRRPGLLAGHAFPRPSSRRWLLAVAILTALSTCLATTDSALAAALPQAAGRNAQEDSDFPFDNNIDPQFEFPQDAEWLNTGGAIRLRDLRGKFVLFDFWTYCCINCMHILPTLEKLEEKYPNELVVIGVHSAKFAAERDAENIKEAILRYNIAHPVINDPNQEIWNYFRVSSWPTLLLFDPRGRLVWGRPGEVDFETLDELIEDALPYYRKRDLLDETPVQFELHAFSVEPTPLSFPGKVLADEASNRLFIADSNHHRIVITTLDGELLETVGTGRVGQADGGFDEAEFNQPQGMALDGDQLYLADTENHLIRCIDLTQQTVRTIAGTGKQGRHPRMMPRPGPRERLPLRMTANPTRAAISSPWALWLHEGELYIAMAGPHQIWKMSSDLARIGPYAGNMREDIVDGPLDNSAFAQPSGLASDGEWLYVADSEGSSIRAVPLNPRRDVKTVVGTAELPRARLFTYGDRDGPRGRVLLQHPLGVVFFDGQLYITDTYNNKVKRVDPQSGATTTFVGTGEPGADDTAPTFDEPAGLSYAAGKLYVADTNNHLIRTIDLETKAVTTLNVEGLTPPAQYERLTRRTGDEFAEGKLQPTPVVAADGHARLRVKLSLPEGWKLNPLAPLSYTVQDETLDGVIDNSALADTATRLPEPQPEFEILLPLKSGQGEDNVRVELVYYFCQEAGEGLCKVGAVAWDVPLQVGGDNAADALELQHEITVSPF